MNTNRPTANGGTWLTPHGAERTRAQDDPMPADVHRDLAGILRESSPIAHAWRPAAAPAAAGLIAAGGHPHPSATPAAPPPARSSPGSKGSWLRRAHSRPAAQF